MLTSPVAANGMIYVVTDKGELVAIREAEVLARPRRPRHLFRHQVLHRVPLRGVSKSFKKSACP